MKSILLRHIIIFSIVAMAAVSCQEENQGATSFDISVNKTEYTTAEFVKFLISGNPDILTFYSGEVGKRQEFANRITADGTPVLNFNSALANGTQAESIFLLVSQDFAGIGSDNTQAAQNIAAATWTDITDKAAWATSSSNKASGNIDLSEFKNKPVFLAFKYKGYTGSKQNKWTISSLTVKNNLSDGTSYTIANHTNTAITNYSVATVISPGWAGRTITGVAWVTSTSNFVITGSTDEDTTQESEAWCLSGPLDLTCVSPDVGTTIKNMSANLTEYEYQYTTAGEYRVSFVGTANNIYGAAEEVKHVDISIVAP